MNQRHDHFADRLRIFAGLDINVGDARGAMLDDQFSERFVIRAETLKFAIVAAHSAIGTILPTEIRNFDDRANENFAPEMRMGQRRCLAMKSLLRTTGPRQMLETGKICGWAHHDGEFKTAFPRATESG